MKNPQSYSGKFVIICSELEREGSIVAVAPCGLRVMIAIETGSIASIVAP
jgi:hypothetical protein